MVWPLIKAHKLEKLAAEWSYLKLDRYRTSLHYWAGELIRGVERFVAASERIIDKLQAKIIKREEAENAELRAKVASLEAQILEQQSRAIH